MKANDLKIETEKMIRSKEKNFLAEELEGTFEFPLEVTLNS